MKRTTYTISTRRGPVAVSGYVFAACGLRLGVSNDNMVNPSGRRFSSWLITELSSGCTIGSVSRVADLGAWIVKKIKSGHIDNVKELVGRWSLGDLNPDIIPAREILFAINRGATV